MSDSKALAIIPRTVDEVRSLSSMFAKSNLMPDHLRGKESDVFVSIMAGSELGLPPMASLRGVHVISGKTVLSADTMVGVVLGSGLATHFSCLESTALVATYETQRKGSPAPQRLSFTIEQAKRAGLNGANWTKFPEAMLRARAKAALARDAYPDVLAGCYDTDEAADFAAPSQFSSRSSAVIDAEIVDAGPDPLDKIADDLIAEAHAATTHEAIEALAPRFAALPKKTPQRARAAEAYRVAKDEIARQGVQEQA